MSLTKFVKMADVKAKLKPLRPKLPRKIPASLKVAPRTTNYMVVGSAFDYLLRFELQRRAPHAMSGPLVAESAPGCIWQPGYFVYLGMDPSQVSPEEAEEIAEKEAKRAHSVVETAKLALALYTKCEAPNQDAQAVLAAHAIRLAKLDDMCRALRLDPSFEQADPDDVEDLLALLAIMPFDKLLNDQVMLLNPTFGEVSSLLGGADTDLISGDMLVDFKTTKASGMQAYELDQLFSYYLLARRQRQVDRTFPVINRLALYYCRHGHLWTLDATAWTENQQFAETEEWFFTRAKEVFSLPNRKLA